VRIFLTLSQKLYVPSDPAVVKVPMGWKFIAFTENMSGDGPSDLWHCQDGDGAEFITTRGGCSRQA
jgi:hypothetical protein